MVPPEVLRMLPAGTQGQQNYFITCPASEPSRSGSCCAWQSPNLPFQTMAPGQALQLVQLHFGDCRGCSPIPSQTEQDQGSPPSAQAGGLRGSPAAPAEAAALAGGGAALPGPRGLPAGFRPPGTPGQHLPGTDERCEDKAAAEPSSPSHSRCHPLAYGRWVAVTFGTVPIGGTPAEPARPAALPLTLAMLLR